MKTSFRKLISILAASSLSFILFNLFASSILALDYEITKVIEVGPCSGGPMLGPLKWSPDGTRLAYFHRNALYVCDTLGNEQEIIEFDMPQHRYEWLSDAEVVIHLRELASKSGLNRLVRVDINDKSYDVLEEFTRRRGVRKSSDPNSFSGPWLSAEGNLYYLKNVIHSTTSRTARLDEPEIIVFPTAKYPPDEKAPELGQNHLLIRENDDILLINGDRSESRNISTKAGHPVALPAVLSPDLDKYMIRNKICNIENNSCITLDTVIKDAPDNTHLCGILYYSFNPKYPEVVFNAIFCYDEENEIYRTATFDYNTGRFRIIDDEIDIEGCMYPAISDDGRKIAFIAPDGIVHILYREVTNETEN